MINNLKVHMAGARKPKSTTSAWQLEFSPAVHLGARPTCHLTFRLAKPVDASSWASAMKNRCDIFRETEISLERLKGEENKDVPCFSMDVFRVRGLRGGSGENSMELLSSVPFLFR